MEKMKSDRKVKGPPPTRAESVQIHILSPEHDLLTGSNQPVLKTAALLP